MSIEKVTVYRYAMIITTFIVLLTVLGSMVPNAVWTNREDPCASLHEAAFMDAPKEVRKLLKSGTNLECKDVLEQTPLVSAVDGASLEAFDVLLKAGANVNVRTQYGFSLLTQTQKKYDSLDPKSGREIRQLYQNIITRLKKAGAVN